MEQDFWHQKWASKDIGFHEGRPNALLVKYFRHLKIPENGRIFLPLCGKTVDIDWLLSQGFRVVGAELSETAVNELFQRLQLQPTIIEHENIRQYQAANIDLFIGDIFDINAALLGPLDAIYDRAALVALPAVMRKQYSQHLKIISDHATQLLITFTYDQATMAGPPFAVLASEVEALYSKNYSIKQLDSEPVAGGLKGQCAATEDIWLLC
ncbi:MAG: thiopurine S-methyltransferase [Pseudomonadales bacterium]|nr:thiopurine S-methyltransferase [Pseudomonadales bacterium]